MKDSYIIHNPVHMLWQEMRNAISSLAFVNGLFPKISTTRINQYKKGVIRYYNTNFPGEKEAFLKVQQSFHEGNKIIKKGGKDFINFQIEGEKPGEMLRNMVDLRNLSKGTPEFVRRMSIVYLVTSFENFLGKILRIYFLLYPKSISPDKKMTNSEILDFDDIETLKKRIIDKELFDLFYEGIDGINEILTKKFGLKLDKYNEWTEFREIFYRRNLILHNDGVPNEVYRKKTGYTGVDKLEIDQVYKSSI